MPIAILSLLGFLTAGYLAIATPAEESRIQWAEADTLATNFVAYRSAVVSYFNANPSATGTVADGSLTYLPGHVRNALWTNLISGGTLYVYSTSAASPGVVEQTWKYSRRSLLVGIKSSSGTLLVPGAGSTSTTVPGAVPVGALVWIGK